MHPRGALRALLIELDVRGLAATPRAVAVALWTHADPCGRCWPSQTTLARLVGRCERTVRAAVKALEAAGVLLRDVPALRERRTRRRTTAYRFTVGSWLPVSARVPLGGASRSTREQPLEAHEVEGDASVRPVDVAPVPDAVELDGDALAAAADDAPVIELDGWTLVEVEGAPSGYQAKPIEGPGAPLAELATAAPSPATAAPPSPATTAGRRSHRFKSPPMPAPTTAPSCNRPPPARCAPVARPWSLPELGAVTARLRRFAQGTG
jgi:hypothetical protein